MTERELERQARHRLAVLRHAEEISGNVSATWRYYGVSRNCFYKWLRRYEAEDLAGLRDRSSKPHNSPKATSTEVVEKILWLRHHYHFGPAKIAMYLQRYHDVPSARQGCGASSSGWALTGCRPRSGTSAMTAAGSGMKSRARATSCRSMSSSSSRSASPVAGASTINSPRSTTAPGCGSCAPTRAATRRPRSSSSTTPWPSCPSPSSACRRTFNGQEFGASFHWHLLYKGIDHVYIKPRTPRLNGKVERSHRIDAEEFYRLLEGQVIDDTELFNDRLQEWEDFYNFNRPHGGLGGQTPYERLRHKTRTSV